MATISAQDLALLIVESLALEGVDPVQIDPRAPLFGEGLGLDSLDLLEVSLVIQQQYGVKLRANNPKNIAIFTSLQSLAEHLNAERASL